MLIICHRQKNNNENIHKLLKEYQDYSKYRILSELSTNYKVDSMWKNNKYFVFPLLQI